MVLARTAMLLGWATVSDSFTPKCPRDDSWTYVLEYFDDKNMDDIPNSEDLVAAGFSNSNAFFVGKDELDKLDVDEMSICIVSVSDCRSDCVTINTALTSSSKCVCAAAASMSTKEKQFAVAMAGTCKPTECPDWNNPIVHLQEDGFQNWNLGTGCPSACGKFGTIASTNLNWHNSQHGITFGIRGLKWENHTHELGWYYENADQETGVQSRNARVAKGLLDADILQIRVRQTTTSTISTTATMSSVTSTSSTTPLVFVDLAYQTQFLKIAAVASAMSIWFASQHT